MKKYIPSKHTIKQMIKFGIVGFFGVLLNYSIFFVLYKYIHTYYLLASATGFIISIFFAFFMNKKYTFDPQNQHPTKLFVKYFAINIFSLLLGMLFLAFLVEIIKLNVFVANFLNIGLTASSNFIGSKFFVFRKK